ncbi:MAG TPA: hypothetical protein PLC07_10685 [Bacillota bacterium]|nr:hypothetical protein [Bacillota bacterium]HPT88177.1 hypothetical protein [Bacillota bacterium]
MDNLAHAAKIACLTFTISLVISFLFEFSLAIWISLAILCAVILTGILFDLIGTAVTAATEAPFHAMGADKVAGSKEAIFLIRHADQVANFCNDVIGDIAGTISGAIVASVILQVCQGKLNGLQDILSASGIALIAACTVGGKSLGKSFAIKRANDIIFTVGRFLSLFKIFDFDVKKRKRKNKPGSRKVKRKNGKTIGKN